MSDELKKAVDALNGALKQLKTLDEQIAGKQQRLGELEKNREELREANQLSAEQLAATNAKVVQARKQADELVALARAEGNQIINAAKQEAAEALRKRDKETKEMREKLRAIVG
jgi:hypothetical protein